MCTYDCTIIYAFECWRLCIIQITVIDSLTIESKQILIINDIQNKRNHVLLRILDVFVKKSCWCLFSLFIAGCQLVNSFGNADGITFKGTKRQNLTKR